MSARFHALFWVGLLLAFFAALWLLSEILLPFVAGIAIAYMLDPLADRLTRLGVGRGLASVILIVLAIMAILLVVVLIEPLLQRQVSEMVQRLPKLVRRAQLLGERLVALAQAELSEADYQRVREAISGRMGDAVGWIARLLQGVLTSSIALFNILSLLFITPIVAFFLLRDWDRLVAQIDSWIPRRHVETVRAQARQVNDTLAGFIRGQGTVCLIVGTFYAVALTAAGLELGLTVGFIAGILGFIPFVGVAVGGILSIGLALLQFDSWTRIAIVAGIFLFGQFVEGHFLTPKLVGDRVNLHPVWVMFALLAFGALFGFVGVLLAVPVAAVLGVLVRFALRRYLESPLYDPDGAARP